MTGLKASRFDYEKRRRRVVARSVGKRPGQVAQEAAPVEEAGQRILVGERLEAHGLGARLLEGDAQLLDAAAQLAQLGRVVMGRVRCLGHARFLAQLRRWLLIDLAGRARLGYSGHALREGLERT
ncbi:MAG TPA: hypothetical protein VKA75_01215 [Reyranella sp.]|nr:hypothetical protein [Reyranella sp.]